MKIAVCISNIGGIDEIFPLCKQTGNYELYYFTENTLPFPLPSLDNRMKAKYIKTQTHKFLSHDVFIHLDSSIEVVSEDFIKICIEELKGNDIVIEMHQQRKNVYEELEYIIEKMKEGDRYLLKRYAKQPLFKEYDYYKQMGLPLKYPLYQCSFFARWNNERLNKIFDDWWDYIMKFSNFDQSQFSFVTWLNQAEIQTIDTKELFIRNKHIGYNL